MLAIIRTRWHTRPLSRRAKRRSSAAPGSLRKKYADIVYPPNMVGYPDHSTTSGDYRKPVLVVDGTAGFDPKPTVGRFTDDRLRIRLSGNERLSHARKRCSRTCVHAETEVLSLQSIPPDRGPPSTVRVAFERAALRPSGLERRRSNVEFYG